MVESQQPPGVVLDHSPASSQIYVGSPSVAVLPDGRYVASHDWFGPGSTYAHTRVFRSEDRGATWAAVSEIDGQFWSGLFLHDGALYLMGTNRQFGQPVIRRSDDGGGTWTTPDSPRTGLLHPDAEHHTAPMPVVRHAGRIWRTMEDRNPPKGWGNTFRAFVMSAPEDADLLEARNWRMSNRLRYDPGWPGVGWLEGNLVIGPDGRPCNILRNHTDGGGRAARLRISDDGSEVAFDPGAGFIDFPGGCKKFTIRRDDVSGLCWSLANWIHPDDAGGNAERTRNTLALVRSADLVDWEVRAVLLRHPDAANVGFQYPDWQFEGDDIIAAVRTAHPDGIGGAHNCHDANFLTFHRFADFRTLETP